MVQSWPPHLALAPLAAVDPPFLPFRDAGYSQADYMLSIQDCVYGLWRAKEAKLLDLCSFNLEEYEKHERVENGDFNWITPSFIAFASPVEPQYEKTKKRCATSALPATFAEVLTYFASHKVGLVVRLNHALYDKRNFEDLDMEHVDLEFPDGTCPEMDIVKHFISLAEYYIEADRKFS